MKQTIKINESQLRGMIAESVKRVLKEYSLGTEDDSYYGGDLPDSYFEEEPEIDIDEPDCDGFYVENSDNNEVLAHFRNKKNAMKYIDDNFGKGHLVFVGFSFKDV